MPWSEVSPMDQKRFFIKDWQRQTFTFVELCHRYGISRKTGYKWINRYLRQGPGGLDESRSASWRASTTRSASSNAARSDCATRSTCGSRS